jgi:hypothetical protein
MADKSPKGLALLLMAKKHPEMDQPSAGPDDMPVSDADSAPPVDENLIDCSHDVLVAIEQKNEEQLAAALKDFVDMCSSAPAEAPETPEASEGEENPEVEGG